MNAFSLTRRNLLAGLAAATAAAAVPASAAATMAPENPALVGLADSLAAAVGEVRAARADYAACVEAWAKLWPAVPDAIRCRDRYAAARDFEGLPIYEADRAVSVMTVANIEADMVAIRKAMARKRKDPSRPFHANALNYYWGQSGTLHDWQAEIDALSDLMAVAIVYEADMARIRSASDFETKEQRRFMSYRGLKRAIGAVMAETALSVEGLIIQAQAMEAWALLEPADRMTTSVINSWASDFAASLIRISTAA